MAVHTPPSPTDTSSPTDGNLRKRVCKACDRCRLKKSKCDGTNPCGRCRADNTICVFGERKKSHDKVYPKGYVEMLEQQQSQLVAGIQQLYELTQKGHTWLGSPLKENTNGHPLTHDILERLGVLKQEGSSGDEHFEEDLHSLQHKLIASGAPYMQRQESSDCLSENDHSPVSEAVPAKRPRNSIGRLPLTPPMDVSRPRNNSADTHHFQSPQPLPNTATAPSVPPSILQQQWPMQMTGVEDSMEFLDRAYDPFPITDFNAISPPFAQTPFAMEMMQNYIPVGDWNQGDAMKTVYDPTLT